MIGINNLTRTRVDKKFLERIAKIVLKKKKKELSIVLVGQARIKELNRKYRKKNQVTDVLSFDYRVRRSRAKVKEEDEVFFAHGDIGEVVICPKIVKENARKYGLSFKEELARVLIHGILHLLGYSHKEMQEKEKYFLLRVKK